MGALASIPDPSQQPIADASGKITRPWFMSLVQLIQNVAGAVIGPSSSLNNQIVLFDGLTGQKIKGATGTGVVHATTGVYSVSDVTLAEIVPATAASRLIGRRSGSAGDWEEVSLGAGLSMSASAVLSASVSSDYVVASDGAQPPTAVDNGAGSFVYVAYTP